MKTAQCRQYAKLKSTAPLARRKQDCGHNQGIVMDWETQLHLLQTFVRKTSKPERSGVVLPKSLGRSR